MTEALGVTTSSSESDTQYNTEQKNHLIMDRRSVLRLAGLGIGSTLGLRTVGAAQAQVANVIPMGPVQYTVQITGQTNRGPFVRAGNLYVFPPLDTSGANFSNGINARDIGLFSGNPSAAPETGAIWFATNNGVFDQVGFQTTTGRALIDVAFVSANEGTGLLEVTLDPNAARTVHLNLMNTRSGITASAYQLLEGTLQLQFSEGGQRVQGEIHFIGNGLIEPGATPYDAVIEGVVAR